MRLAGLVKPLRLLRVNINKRLISAQYYATEAGQEEYAFNSKEYLDFKKQLRQQSVYTKDGHTCLQVECRLCERLPAAATTTTSRTQAPLAYINKRTGMLEVK